MVLKEKFSAVLHQTKPHFVDVDADVCEQIADEFSIGFYNWMQNNYCQVGDGFVKDLSISNSKGVIITTEKALEIYKKEEGL